ncbi:STY4534 family ICE replication protein [Pasteurella oralis]|uniref:STY4534 family ICE replication protein n=1 Tax=Pasteurella oralis TaxID=1071947 RepID=UPI000C7DDEEC|nr:STY4534 family ICE replication protein [Pasteurella oralis]
MTTQQNNYFNLHTSGIGYLNDIRQVKPKKGQPFVACRVSALVGSSNEPEFRYFDMNVVGQEAEKLILRCDEAVKAKKKVLISFVMSDLWYDTFIYAKESKFHKVGDVGVTLKGRLIRIKLIKIDGEIKYQEKVAEPKQTNEPKQFEQPDEPIPSE